MSSVLPGLDSNQQPSGVLRLRCDSRSNQLNVPWKIELRLTSLNFYRIPDSPPVKIVSTARSISRLIIGYKLYLGQFIDRL